MSDTPTTTTPTPDYGEPWQVVPSDPTNIESTPSVRARDGKWVVASMPRIIACINACAGMVDPAAEIAMLKQAGAANARLHLKAVDAAAENATLRNQLDRICTQGFDDQDTIGGEPADDYVLCQLAAMRDAIREAHTQIRYAEASFAGMALRLHPADPGNDAVLTRTGAALAKLQPFITP